MSESADVRIPVEATLTVIASGPEGQPPLDLGTATVIESSAAMFTTSTPEILDRALQLVDADGSVIVVGGIREADGSVRVTVESVIPAAPADPAAAPDRGVTVALEVPPDVVLSVPSDPDERVEDPEKARSVWCVMFPRMRACR